MRSYTSNVVSAGRLEDDEEGVGDKINDLLVAKERRAG